jgi:hypothetical protein
VALYIRAANGPSVSLTAVTSASTATTRGSNVTIASWVSRLTWARVTPGTLSSADRTATMHPSQSIPSTANVTVAKRGEVRHALAQRAKVTRNRRLVMGVCPRARYHITKARFVNAGMSIVGCREATQDNCGGLVWEAIAKADFRRNASIWASSTYTTLACLARTASDRRCSRQSSQETRQLSGAFPS